MVDHARRRCGTRKGDSSARGSVSGVDCEEERDEVEGAIRCIQIQFKLAASSVLSPRQIHIKKLPGNLGYTSPVT